MPPVNFFQDLGAHNVGRHEVRSELDALVLEPEHGAERLDQARLGNARHADQERVAAGQDRDEGEVDDAALAENDGGGGFTGGVDLGAHFLDAVDKLSFRGSGYGHGLHLVRLVERRTIGPKRRPGRTL